MSLFQSITHRIREGLKKIPVQNIDVRYINDNLVIKVQFSDKKIPAIETKVPRADEPTIAIGKLLGEIKEKCR